MATLHDRSNMDKLSLNSNHFYSSIENSFDTSRASKVLEKKKNN